jgi:nucleoside-diphosphate-sugar epimerase
LIVLIQASRPDALINCAGRTTGTSEQLWEINTTFVDNLIQALRVAGPTPLVHLGSAAEYGVQPEGVNRSPRAPSRAPGEQLRPFQAGRHAKDHLAATERRATSPRRCCASSTRSDCARRPTRSLGAPIDQLILAQKHRRRSISLGSAQVQSRLRRGQ